MKITFLEPLGISNDSLREIMEKAIGTQHEVTYYLIEMKIRQFWRREARGPIV